MVHHQNAIETSSSSWFKTALAGLVGTIPMTIFMLATQRLLPKGQRYALPPEIIIEELARRAHIKHHMSKIQIQVATLISHFGYGATMGALYTPLDKRLPLPPAVKGILFGLAIWLGSYLALLPLLHIKESAHTETERRNLLMITAHVIWGSVMGMVTNILMNR